jgi:hypothetical protein
VARACDACGLIDLDPAALDSAAFGHGTPGSGQSM